MAGDGLTPADNALLIVLMAEAREVLNTELKEKYGLDVKKVSRDRLKQFVDSRPSGRTYALQLADKGWVQVQEQLRLRSNGSTAQAAAASAILDALRDRVLERSGCQSFAELFALSDVRGPVSVSAQNPDQDHLLRTRVGAAYAALKTASDEWVSLARLRPFFSDVPRAALDDALRRLSREPGVTLAPTSNQKALTAADHEAALHIGGQDKHVLAIAG